MFVSLFTRLIIIS